MKTSIYLAVVLMASALGSAAQAGEQTKSTDHKSTAASWTDMAAAPWQMVEAPLPAAIKVSEVGIFPAVVGAGKTPAHRLAEEGASKALMAPASVLASNKDFGLNSILAYVNLPQANYSFPGQTGAASANRAKTELAGKFEAAKGIAEPATEVLMLGALAALAIAVRRRMPNERF